MNGPTPRQAARHGPLPRRWEDGKRRPSRHEKNHTLALPCTGGKSG